MPNLPGRKKQKKLKGKQQQRWGREEEGRENPPSFPLRVFYMQKQLKQNKEESRPGSEKKKSVPPHPLPAANLRVSQLGRARASTLSGLPEG